ncbi:hypothetical protein BJ322DRAFT_778563 [Thelephora terrestris]|uniref:Uncharacterized protein n=1 Tax=Thelephora terrestris TaxID=56493 RepID=A0A9P6HHU0_9AGAM|nr:hypothetical protein BJ322DRAFT_778563 [Thelephora terrestris]
MYTVVGIPMLFVLVSALLSWRRYVDSSNFTLHSHHAMPGPKNSKKSRQPSRRSTPLETPLETPSSTAAVLPSIDASSEPAAQSEGELRRGESSSGVNLTFMAAAASQLSHTRDTLSPTPIHEGEVTHVWALFLFSRGNPRSSRPTRRAGKLQAVIVGHETVPVRREYSSLWIIIPALLFLVYLFFFFFSSS